MKVLTGGGGGVGEQQFTLLASGPVPRVLPDGTISTVYSITCYAPLYGVTFTFFVTQQSFEADGAPNLANLKTADVNAVCAHEHVQGFRTEQDQDRSELLVNNAVITVGTDDESITTDVTQRMDSINTPATFTLVDDAWKRLVALGAPAAGA